jgi:hypothetical protein
VGCVKTRPADLGPGFLRRLLSDYCLPRYENEFSSDFLAGKGGRAFPAQQPEREVPEGGGFVPVHVLRELSP